MKRLILPLVTCLLVGLVIVDRMSRMESTTLSAAPPSDSVADLGGQAAARPLPAPSPTPGSNSRSPPGKPPPRLPPSAEWATGVRW